MTNKWYPGERCELDYTTLNLFLFDSTSGKRTPERPVVTVCIDHTSGVIVGFNIRHRKPQGNGE
jgi:hypothetical protein